MAEHCSTSKAFTCLNSFPLVYFASVPCISPKITLQRYLHTLTLLYILSSFSLPRIPCFHCNLKNYLQEKLLMFVNSILNSHICGKSTGMQIHIYRMLYNRNYSWGDIISLNTKCLILEICLMGLYFIWYGNTFKTVELIQ